MEVNWEYWPIFRGTIDAKLGRGTGDKDDKGFGWLSLFNLFISVYDCGTIYLYFGRRIYSGK